MTPAQAAELLAHCAAFDRRTIGEADARAWARALHDIPLDDDLLDSIAEHYAHSDQWVTVAQVRQIRARIRAGRIDAAHPVYDGDPDETGEQFVARRRAQISAAANGNLPARTISQALDATPPAEVLALTAGVGRQVDSHDEDKKAPRYIDEATRATIRTALPGTRKALPQLAVPCPNEKCRAGARRPCKTYRGTELRQHTHGSRRDAYAVTCTHCPECGAAPGQPCGAVQPHAVRIRTAMERAA